MDSVAQLELLIRGTTVGALLVTGAGIWLTTAPRTARLSGVIFCLTIATYVIEKSAVMRDATGLIPFLIGSASYSVTGFVWLFLMVAFEDRPITWPNLIPALGIGAMGAWGMMTNCGRDHPIWTAKDIASVILAGHGLFIVARGWRGDLVEARRALRGPFLAIVLAFVIIQTVVDAIDRKGLPSAWGDYGNAWAMMVLSLSGAFVFLRAGPALFGAPRRQEGDAPAETAGLNLVDQGVLDRLNRFMGPDEGWRQEGLTIGAVAQVVGAPEHRLRKLINEHMGHRNFAAFVNAFRIAAAKQALAQPEKARTTIAVLAFDLGFASLGPFNRAFKDATGVSPREWRRQALGPAAAAE